MAAGDPTGDDLCVGTTNGNTLPESPAASEEREITFGSPIELTSGVTYAIVVRAAGGSFGASLRWENKSGVYGDGARYSSSNSGSSWSIQGSNDLWFQTKASAVVKDSFTFTPVGSRALVWTNYWSAQTFLAESTYTISSVVLRLDRDAGASPGVVTVSIRAVAAAPEKATTPAPANAATDVTLDQATLTWEDGGGADTYNVYYGDTSGDLSLVSSAQAGTSFTVTGITLGSPYSYLITRYWRIDSINAAGTTTGDEWSFTTIRLSPPTVTHWYSTTGQYYQLLIQSDGSYGDHPADGGVENTDFVYLAAEYVPNFIKTTRKLVAAANNKIWYEQ